MILLHKHNLHAILLALGLPVAAAYADNVDVSTIPQRDTVQLTIYNSEDLTLVRETRHITFSKGDNPLQFSWVNTLIDPTSVDLRFQTHAQELDILDTTFPHDKPQMLYWNVKSDFNGSAVVEISYFTSGITWAADYVCVADTAEERMSFDGFVRITNNSGEDYENAQVRLVVGEINLVERIADLARRGLVSQEASEQLRLGARVRKLEKRARGYIYADMAGGMEDAARAPKAIVKEGLSEYFIFTIEGTETIANTWSKRLRLFQGASVPFQIKYRYRPAEYGDQLVRLYILRNDEASSLGESPLPDGVVRLFRDNGRDGLSFLTAYSSKYVPIGQEIELNLGPDPQVIHERLRLRSWRDDFWFRSRKGKTYFSPTKGHQIRQDFPVAGWDDHEQRVERIRNYRDKPIEVEIRLSFQGHVVFTSELDPKLHDYRSPQFSAQIKPAERKDLGYEVTYHQGINRKQDDVTLKKPD
ncbi:MAG: DUF4139 domain-containing protein [Planctomycetes bacterium]|nr:DUF4139 domain-containing protein [Planctomycetota bacterium]